MNKKNENKFTLRMSLMEIYMEKVIDLLNRQEIKENSNNLILKKLCKIIINSPEEAINYIITGNRLRHIAPTLQNSENSRSHVIITFYIENKSLKENIIKKSVFHIFDLAGSERQKKSGSEGERMREAGAINKSLFTLGRVITAFNNNEEQNPFRESIFTLMLQDSIGGNAKTSIITTISQLENNFSETINSLEFAQKAKKIKNKAIINEEYIKKEENKKIKNLQKINNQLTEKCEQLEINQTITLNEKEELSKIIKMHDEEIKKMINDILEKDNELSKYKEENIKLQDIIEKKDINIQIITNELNNLKDENYKHQKEISNIKENYIKLGKESSENIFLIKELEKIKKI